MSSSNDRDSPAQLLRRNSLPYKELIGHLRRVHSSHGMQRVTSSQLLEGDSGGRTFAELLDAEVEKIVLYFISRSGYVSQALMDIRSSQTVAQARAEHIEGVLERYREVAKELYELVRYLDYNVTALQKVLRRHDRQYDVSMSSMYFDSRLGGVGAGSRALLQLYHQEGLTALVSTLRRGFEDAHSALRAVKNGGPRAGFSPRVFQGPSLGGGKRPNSYGDLLRASFKQPTTVKSSSMLHDSSRRQTIGISGPVVPAPRSVSELEPMMGKIELVVAKFFGPTKTVTECLTARSEIALEMSERQMLATDDSDSDDELDITLDLKPKAALPYASAELLLVLSGTFLFMCNLFIVAPTSALLVDRLGQTPSLSGAIMAMSPLGACVSAYLYSAWTNESFKAPMVFCTAVLVAGNLLYALSLQCDSIALAFIGRILTGLGASRVIARRYIVDHVPASERNEAARNFITAGALGLAAGPLLAALLYHANTEFDVTVSGALLMRFEMVTAPGWCMFYVWSVYFAVLLVSFSDPLESEMHHKRAAWDSERLPFGTPAQRSKTSRKNSYSSIRDQEVVGVVNMPSAEGLERDDSYAIRMPADYFVRTADRPPAWWELVSGEVWVILVIYFVNRVGQEIVVVSCPMVTAQLFNWSSEQSGYFMALSGAVVLPANLLVSWYFQETEDRVVLLALSCLCVVASVGTCASSSDSYSSAQFALGATVLFAALNAIEGTVMCLLARVVSPALASSTFNSSLLSTEAGTLGRAVGDLLIAAVGSTQTKAALVDTLYGPFALAMLATAVCIVYMYNRLE